MAVTTDGVFAHRRPRMIGWFAVIGKIRVVPMLGGSYVILGGNEDVRHLPGMLEIPDRIRGELL